MQTDETLCEVPFIGMAQRQSLLHAKLSPELEQVLAERERKFYQRMEAEREIANRHSAKQEELLQAAVKRQEYMRAQVATAQQEAKKQQNQVEELLRVLQSLDRSMASRASHLIPETSQAVPGSSTLGASEGQDPPGEQALAEESRPMARDVSHVSSCEAPDEVLEEALDEVEAPGSPTSSQDTIAVEVATIVKTAQTKTSMDAEAAAVKEVHHHHSKSKVTLEGLVSSPQFSWCCGAVICSNAVFVGYASQYAIDHRDDGPDGMKTEFIRIMDHLYFSFYFCELLLKMFVYRVGFFTNQDKAWNIFDFILVISAIYELVTEVSDFEGPGGDYTWMRVLRLLKMLRMLRVVRVMRFFRELRLMLHSIIGSIRTLFWSMMMLALIMYIFGLCFVQAVQEADEDLRREADDHWGSIMNSILTLYKAISGGADWEGLAEPLKEVGAFYYGIFLFYIAFITFAVLNVVTGMVVDQAMKVAQFDQAAELDKETSVVGDAEILFESLDSDGSGCLTWEELAQHSHNPKVRAFFKALGLKMEEVKEIFQLLAHSGGSDKVTMKTFVDGCVRFRSPAKSIDVISLGQDVKRFNTLLVVLMGYVEDRVTEVWERLSPSAPLNVPSLTSRLEASRCLPKGSSGMGVKSVSSVMPTPE